LRNVKEGDNIEKATRLKKGLVLLTYQRSGENRYFIIQDKEHHVVGSIFKIGGDFGRKRPYLEASVKPYTNIKESLYKKFGLEGGLDKAAKWIVENYHNKEDW
jgi:hypothetical protein